MTPEEIADAQEARAVIQHAKWLEQHDAYMQQVADAKAAQIADAARSERRTQAVEAQTITGQRIAAENNLSNRLAVLVDSATQRLSDRTTTAGRADVPGAVAEALALLLRAEAELALAPSVLAPPGGVG